MTAPLSADSEHLQMSVIVPFYNEAGNITTLVDELRDVLGHAIRYEIILVNDGSTDGGETELDQLLTRSTSEAWAQPLTVLHHEKRSGKSRAMFTAFQHVKGDWIQALDGDLQNDPGDILNLWRFLEANPPSPNLGLVNGHRKRRNDGVIKMLSSRLANGIRGSLLRDRTADTGCGFKLIRREVLHSFPFFDGLHRFMPALARRAGWQTMDFRVNDRRRQSGQSKYGFFDRLTVGIFDLLGVVWLLNRGSFPGKVTVAHPPSTASSGTLNMP